jgi:hypothetical protein
LDTLDIHSLNESQNILSYHLELSSSSSAIIITNIIVDIIADIIADIITDIIIFRYPPTMVVR